MRVEIDGWAWIPVDEIEPAYLQNMKNQLVVIPRKTVEFDKSEVRSIKLYSLEREGMIGIPREFFLSKAKKNHQIVDLTSAGSPIDLESNVEQVGDFAEQAVATEKFMKHIEETGSGGILHAMPAWGKTAWALELIRRLGMTAMVVVNREFLMNQWRKRIERFLPGARVGVVQQDKCEFEDKDIVIGMVHSLAQRKYPQAMYDYFGTVVFDECHRVPAYSWSKVPPLFPAGVRIGLTATPRRKDGTDVVFWWHLGKIVFKATKATPMPKVRRVFTGWNLPQKLRKQAMEARQKKPLKMPSVLKIMVKNEGRNSQIVDELMKASLSKSRRKVLVLSDRLAHMETLKDELLETLKAGGGSEVSVDFYIGGRSEKELAKAERAQIIFGTYQMALEALDIPAVDTVMLVTPRGDVEQAVGRVRRWCKPDDKDECQRLCSWRADGCKGKPQPIVVDFMDDEDNCKGRAGSRMRFYRANGFV